MEIDQKVELIEEKARNFFSYWLEVAQNTIEKKGIIEKTIIDEKMTQHTIEKKGKMIIDDKMIIFIIEGVDKFVD